MKIIRFLALAAGLGLLASPAQAQQAIDWDDSVSSLGLDAAPGAVYGFECPASGRAATVWGTETYTHDSAICVAAVHAGVINLTDGGVVTLTMRPGRDGYPGSVANGIASRDYGAWGHSYVFGAEGGDGAPGARQISWSDTAVGLGFEQVGAVVFLTCPAGGSVAATIWGTDVYTNDSAICVAAVHAGKITAAAGGRVVIRVEAGEASYTGSARNGVASADYGGWGGSFVFLK